MSVFSFCNSSVSTRIPLWWSYALWLLPLAWLWFQLINHLRVEWSVNPQYGYGWGVPFLCAYLVWQSLTGGTGKSSSEGGSPRHSSTAAQGRFIIRLPTSIWYLLLALCALLYAPTRLIEEANPEWRLVSWALAVEVVGLTLLWAYATASATWSSDDPGGAPGESGIGFPLSNFQLRRADFAICFFLVAVPWPTAIEAPLIQSLTRANASTTVELMQLAGIPAVQRGNVIEIATGIVGIDEACSGIRSFQAALMISLFLGELYRLSVPRRVLCILAGFVLSFVFNVGRTTLLVWVASRQGVTAISAWHDPAGVTVLLCCFFGLWGLAVSLRKPGAGGRRQPQAGSPETGARSQNSEIRAKKLEAESQCSASSAPQVQKQDCPISPPALVGVPPEVSEFRALTSALPATCSLLSPLPVLLRRLALALAVWLLAVEVSIEWWYRSHEAQLVKSAVWTVDLSQQDSNLRKLPMTEAAQRILRYDEAMNVGWENQGLGFQVVFLRWNPGRTALHLAKGHTPEVCLTAAGRKLAPESELRHFDVSGLRMPFRSYAVMDEGRSMYVFYCLWDDLAGEQSFETTSLNYENRLRPVLAGRRNPGQRSIEIAVWGAVNGEGAEAAVQEELEKLIVIK